MPDSGGRIRYPEGSIRQGDKDRYLHSEATRYIKHLFSRKNNSAHDSELFSVLTLITPFLLPVIILACSCPRHSVIASARPTQPPTVRPVWAGAEKTGTKKPPDDIPCGGWGRKGPASDETGRRPDPTTVGQAGRRAGGTDGQAVLTSIQNLFSRSLKRASHSLPFLKVKEETRKMAMQLKMKPGTME